MMAYLPNWYIKLGSPKAAKLVEDLANDYFDVWTDLVAENFYGELEQWCHEHGISSIGHQDMDHRTYNLATVSGHFFKNSAHNDHPGIDVILDQITPGRFNDFPRYAGSAARVIGKKRAMSESLSLMGYGMHADAIRYVLEHQIIRGVTQFFLMWLTYDHDTRAPPELSPVNPMITAFSPILNERIGRTSTLMNVGISNVEVALYLPIYDINVNQARMGHPHAGNNVWLPWEITDQIAEYLCYLPCEFDYIWDEALLTLEIGGGGFKSPKGHTYRVLIIPSSPSCTLKPEIVKRLRAFCEKGGKILMYEQPIKEIEDLAILCLTMSDLNKHLPQRVSIEPKGTRISLAGRIDGKREIYLLLNEDMKAHKVTIKFPGQGRLLEIDPNDGSLVLLTEKEPLQVKRKFDATALCVFVVDRASELTANPAPIPEDAPVQLSGWKLALPSGRVVVIDKEWPDWGELGFPTYTGWMTYTIEFEWPYSTNMAMLDLGEVCYGAEIILDGKKVAVVAFRPYRVTVSGLIRGKHRLDIRVLNTMANEVCGTRDHEKTLFKDSPPLYLTRDRRKIRSGLFGPVTLIPLSSP